MPMQPRKKYKTVETKGKRSMIQHFTSLSLQSLYGFEGLDHLGYRSSKAAYRHYAC